MVCPAGFDTSWGFVLVFVELVNLTPTTACDEARKQRQYRFCRWFKELKYKP
jgi:hypothetical protein